MRTPFFEKSVLKLSPKNFNCGDDLISSKQLHHHRIKSFDRTFSKVRGWRAEPPRSDSQDMFWLCNHFQPSRRLMATKFHEQKKTANYCRLFNVI